LHWDARRGSFETVQVLDLAPKSFHGVTGGADIVFDSQARFAYAADRFDDIVVTFAVSPADGKLTLLNRISCGGKIPRHLTVDPSGRWLLVANQESDNIAVFLRDARSGALKASGSFPLSKPQCLVFA
ncbi:MAG: beta-propeller fold lactonase family protein, partial [Edaphobacter sp.]